MPEKVYNATIPYTKFDCLVLDDNIATKLLRSDVTFEAEGNLYKCHMNGKSFWMVIDMYSDDVVVHLTDLTMINESFQREFIQLRNVVMWNLFHPHKPGRHEAVTEMTWVFTYAGPRTLLSDIDVKYIKKYGKNCIAGSFNYFDWIFATLGEELPLIESFRFEYGSLVSSQIKILKLHSYQP